MLSVSNPRSIKDNFREEGPDYQCSFLSSPGNFNGQPELRTNAWDRRFLKCGPLVRFLNCGPWVRLQEGLSKVFTHERLLRVWGMAFPNSQRDPLMPTSQKRWKIVALEDYGHHHDL